MAESKMTKRTIKNVPSSEVDRKVKAFVIVSATKIVCTKNAGVETWTIEADVPTVVDAGQ